MKYLILSVSLLLVSVSVLALNPKKSKTRYYRHEVNVSIGGINPGNSASDAYGYKLMDKFNLIPMKCGFNDLVGCSDDKPDLDVGSTLMSLGYYYHIDERLALGGYLNYVQAGKTFGWYEPYELNGNLVKGYSDINGISFFLMPAIKYSWLNNRWCSLYSKAAIGLNYLSLKFESEIIPQEMVGDLKNSNSVRFAYTFTPLGWEIGKQKVRWFIEAGFGSNTNLKIGLAYRFKRF